MYLISFISGYKYEIVPLVLTNPHIESLRDPCVRSIPLLKLIRISPLPPTKSYVLDLCSYSCGDQVIFLAMVGGSVFLLLLLLFNGVYHNNMEKERMRTNQCFIS